MQRIDNCRNDLKVKCSELMLIYKRQIQLMKSFDSSKTPCLTLPCLTRRGVGSLQTAIHSRNQNTRKRQLFYCISHLHTGRNLRRVLLVDIATHCLDHP
jgi:hypothetical protein